MSERLLKSDESQLLPKFISELFKIHDAIERGEIVFPDDQDQARKNQTLNAFLELKKIRDGEESLFFLQHPLYVIRFALLENPDVFPEMIHKIELLLFYARDGIHVRDLLSGLDESQLDRLSTSLREFLKNDDELSDERRRVLNALFIKDSVSMVDSMESAGISEELKERILQHPFFGVLLDILLPYSDQFSHQIALILPHIQDKNVKRSAYERLNVKYIASDVNFRESFKGWSLCDAAELKLISALQEDGTVLVTDENGEGLIVVKFRGKFAGLVVRSFVTNRGQVIPRGLWVSPVGKNVRSKLRSAFDHDHQTLSLSDSPGDWAIMRTKVDENMIDLQNGAEIGFEDILRQATKAREQKRLFKTIKLPKFLIYLRNRRYREVNKEE